ncbi:hypothetical protein ACS0TY_024286 [Phlomoides rotata]
MENLENSRELNSEIQYDSHHQNSEIVVQCWRQRDFEEIPVYFWRRRISRSQLGQQMFNKRQ